MKLFRLVIAGFHCVMPVMTNRESLRKSMLFTMSHKLFPLLLFALFIACSNKPPTAQPRFTQFIYQGNDAVYKENPLEADEFYSPILQGCYPDPSIVRKGNDYYLVCSSFAFYPGVPIFHSATWSIGSK